MSCVKAFLARSLLKCCTVHTNPSVPRNRGLKPLKSAPFILLGFLGMEGNLAIPLKMRSSTPVLALACACGVTAFNLSPWRIATRRVDPPSLAQSRQPAAWWRAAGPTMALKGLAKKAKEAEVKARHDALVASQPDSPIFKRLEEGRAAAAQADAPKPKPGKMTEVLRKAPGTLAVVAEYCRVLKSGFVNGVLEPEIFSPMFRDAGASAMALATDEKTGGCDLTDVRKVAKEQGYAKGSFPSPLPLIVKDLVVDEFQICEAMEAGAESVTLSLSLVGKERCEQLMRFAAHFGVEPIVQITSAEEAVEAASIGATIVVLVGKHPQDAIAMRKSIPEGLIAGVVVDRRSDEGMEEIEDCWLLRDEGYQVIWVSEVLYKGGGDQTRSSLAVIKAIRAKSSVKYGRARALSGKGEGAKEYLGTIAT